MQPTRFVLWPKALETPVGRHLIELLPRPLDHDQCSARHERTHNPLDDLYGIDHVMKRRRRDDGVHLLDKLDLLERDGAVLVSGGGVRVDAGRFVPTRAEHRDEATVRAAANFDYPRRRSG
jgi:hypothetical protein